MNLAFIPYDTCYSHYRQTILEVSDKVTDKVTDIYCRQPTSHKTITYWLSSIFLTDTLPTCLRHLSPTFTSALPPLLPPHYRQNNICTDILHRHLHRQNCINLQRSQTNCKLITFPKLSQKKEEEGDHRKKQVYTLLYKDNTSTVLNIQSRC